MFEHLSSLLSPSNLKIVHVFMDASVSVDRLYVM